jgi:uncharacterized membrane protein YdjX (TVP38/TMEM64 family)
MRREGGPKAAKVRMWVRVLFPVAASLLGLVTLRLLGPDVVSQRQLSDWIHPLGPWAPAAFVLFLAVRPLTLLPGQVFTAVGGILFGTLAGSLYALAGSFLASALTYVLAWKLGTRFMKRMAGNRYSALRRTARRHDFTFGLLMCLNPIVPTDVMVALGAATGARFWPTVMGVLVGTLPGTVLTAQFGSALSQGKTVMTVVSAVGLVVSLVAGVFVGRRAYREVMHDQAEGRGSEAPAAATHGPVQAPDAPEPPPPAPPHGRAHRLRARPLAPAVG